MTRPGFLVVDKPEGITSHDLIVRARKILKTRKVGHAGTLDPMATGVMVLGVESATRLLDYVMAGRKRYLATIKVGTLTTTDDRMGEVLDSKSVDDVTMEGAEEQLRSMVGTIEQVPSRVSAIKVDGKRSYDRVRSGEEVELKPRRVEIFELTVLARRSDEFDIDVSCSAGTYIRAIARDVGGHLTALRRIESQPFTIADCHPIDSGELIPAKTAISRILASYQVGRSEQRELALGRTIEFIDSALSHPSLVVGAGETAVIAAISDGDDVIALLKRVDDRLQPIAVLPECRNDEAK